MLHMPDFSNTREIVTRISSAENWSVRSVHTDTSCMFCLEYVCLFVKSTNNNNNNKSNLYSAIRH